MSIDTELVYEQTGPQNPSRKRYKIQYPISDYTFPTEALIHKIHLSERHLHVELTDGRDLSIPLWWIPTLHHAEPEEREKYEISRDRTMIIWNPDRCAINDEVRISDYLGPSTRERRLMEEAEPILQPLRVRHPDLSDQEIIVMALQDLLER